MTDRELLELAAKAAGLDGYVYEWVDGPYFIVPADPDVPRSEPKTYDWLNDDGDALRLAVKLKIPMQFPDWSNQCATWGSRDSNEQFVEAAIDHNGDLAAATRRAIVRAAAAIGGA